MQSPEQQTTNPQDASRHVVSLLQLRNTVRCIPAIRNALDGTSSQLLQTIRTLLSDSRLADVESLLAAGLNDDAGLGKVTDPRTQSS